MTINITDATQEDLPAILRIERLGFTAAEAGTATQYQERLKYLKGTFLVAKANGTLVGFVVGPAVTAPLITDQMYAEAQPNLPTGGNQMILTIAVDPASRGQHVGTQLLTAMAKRARAAKRQTIALTCLAKNVPFYEKNGFHNLGVANSQHANEVWINMVKPLSSIQ